MHVLADAYHAQALPLSSHSPLFREEVKGKEKMNTQKGYSTGWKHQYAPAFLDSASRFLVCLRIASFMIIWRRLLRTSTELVPVFMVRFDEAFCAAFVAARLIPRVVICDVDTDGVGGGASEVAEGGGGILIVSSVGYAPALELGWPVCRA